jgi:hypothetical protein
VNYPSGIDTDLERSYIRFRAPSVRGPAATGRKFYGLRVALSIAARMDALGGNMADATDVVRFSISEYAGYVDIIVDDELRDSTTNWIYTVLGTRQEADEFYVALKVSQRPGRASQ